MGGLPQLARRVAREALRSPALRVAAVFAAAGAAFTVGNLVFARVMSKEDYGLLSLFMAIVSVSTLAAPMGLDQLIARHGLAFGGKLRRVTLAASALSGIVTAGIGALLYRMETSMWLALFAATVAGGATQSLARHFQNRGRPIAVPLLQASNWLLVPVAVLAAAAGFTDAVSPALLLTGASVLTALTGWVAAMRSAPHGGGEEPVRPLFIEAASLMSITVAGSVLLQLERLIMPFAIGLEELGRYGVLAALVGSPFRMVQAAVTFTVVPRMRAARTVPERRRLLQRESLLVIGACAGFSAIMWPLAPYLAHWLLEGRYDLTAALMAATLVSGALKICSAFATSTATALAPASALHWLSVGTWASIGVGSLGALLGSQWGLAGVIYGICAGWVARCVVSLGIALPHLRVRRDPSAP
jgi:hypothetical protein